MHDISSIYLRSIRRLSATLTISERLQRNCRIVFSQVHVLFNLKLFLTVTMRVVQWKRLVHVLVDAIPNDLYLKLRLISLVVDMSKILNEEALHLCVVLKQLHTKLQTQMCVTMHRLTRL